jgi:hypothetical protein
MFKDDIKKQMPEGVNLTELQIEYINTFLIQWLDDGYRLMRMYADADAVKKGIDVTTHEYRQIQDIFWDFVSIQIVITKLHDMFRDGSIDKVVTSVLADVNNGVVSESKN